MHTSSLSFVSLLFCSLSFISTNKIIRQPLSQESQQPQIEAVGGLQGCHTHAMGKFQTQYQAERSTFDKQELGSNILVAAGIDYLEGSAKSRSIRGEVLLQPIKESDSSTGSCSQRQGRRRDDGQRQTMKARIHQTALVDNLQDDGFAWSKYGKRRIHGSYYPRKTTQTWAKVSHTIDDDHAWRKYGQKEILNAKHPRSYFRCARKYGQGCRATKQVQRMDEDPLMYQITYIGLHTCKDPLKAPQIIMESDPRETSIFNNPPDSMWGNGKQADDHDQALSSSTTPTIKQESKEEAVSDLTDNLSSLGTDNNNNNNNNNSYLWTDFKDFELVEPAIVPPKLGSDNGDVVSTMYSCTETASHHGLDSGGHFDGDFNFDDI